MFLKLNIIITLYVTVAKRKIQELKEKVHQVEKEVTSEADKVSVLKQHLSQAKTDWHEQICMKDKARIAAEQQLQQTQATLEHEIHMKDQAEWKFNQEKAGLQHEIEARDQENASLRKQIHRMKANLQCQTEMNKQAMVSSQQKITVLEHQIEANEQERVDLGVQLVAKDKEKAKLQKQLHQKEQQIQAKDQEKAELQQKLHQKEEQIQAKEEEKLQLEKELHRMKGHNPPEMIKVTQVAGVQQEESSSITAQGEMASVHQLLQAREEVRTKEEELRKVRQEHEVELSRLTHESKLKLQEIELELKAQIGTKSEEIEILQSQADALQHDREDLQQLLKAKFTVISKELQHNQDRVETLTSHIGSLEARFREVEFLRDHYSHEVDQLRKELMAKIAEVDQLRKEQEDMVPAKTHPPTG